MHGKTNTVLYLQSVEGHCFHCCTFAFLISLTDRRMNRRYGLERSCERIKKKMFLKLARIRKIVTNCQKHQRQKTSRAPAPQILVQKGARTHIKAKRQPFFDTPRGVFFNWGRRERLFSFFSFCSRGSCWLLDGAFFIWKVLQSPC